MTVFEEMIRIAPLHVYFRNGRFHCNWSPSANDGKGGLIHGRGGAMTPYAAVVAARADAVEQGWKA